MGILDSSRREFSSAIARQFPSVAGSAGLGTVGKKSTTMITRFLGRSRETCQQVDEMPPDL